MLTPVFPNFLSGMGEVVCIIGVGCERKRDGLFQVGGPVPHLATLVPLEILDVFFVLFCLIERIKGAQVAALAGGRIFLAGIKPELAGF